MLQCVKQSPVEQGLYESLERRKCFTICYSKW